jgi:hypothetical protein
MRIFGSLIIVAVLLAEATAAASGSTYHPTPLLKAYHGLHKARLRKDGWEDFVRQFDLILVFPPVPAKQLAAVRAVHPAVILLAYTNCRSLPYQRYPADYWARLDALLPAEMRVRNPGSGDLVHDPHGASYFVMTQAVAESLVVLHRDFTMTWQWDGIFLDNCTPTIPGHILKAITLQTEEFDFDNDGVLDTVEDAQRSYETWRPYFTRRLREELGDGVILIANSGGVLDDPQLNGISLEAIGTLWTEEEATDILERQRAVGRSPWLGIGWVENATDIDPTSSLARRLDGVYYGVKRQFPLPPPR